MTVTGTTSATAAPTAAQTGALGSLSEDYTLFLKLLTSQMQNQDPLDPMDTSQYTQQLVQYSQVEQSIQQNATLRDILARLSSQDMVQASALIGREAGYDGAVAGLSESAPARWTWSSTQAPDTLVATISDASGRTVRTIPLEPGSTALDWDGTLADGSRAGTGSYTLALDARDAAGSAIATTIGGAGIISSVAQQDGSIGVIINGITVPASGLRLVAAGSGSN